MKIDKLQVDNNMNKKGVLLIKEFWKENKYVLLILLLAFGVRVWGINFGTPNLFIHSDENEYASAARAFVLGKKSPYANGLPVGSFYYLLSLVYWVFSWFIKDSSWSDFILTGRFFSVVLSTVSVGFTYLIGRKLFNKRVGYVSALVLALIPIDVQIAHYLKEDVYIQFFGMVGLYFLVRAWKNKIGFDKNIFLAILFTTLAGSAKINGFFFTLPVFAFLFLGDERGQFNIKNVWKLSKRKLWILFSIVIAGLAFYLNSPISFMDAEPGKKYSLAAILSPEPGHAIFISNQDGVLNFVWWLYYLLTSGIGYFLFPLMILAVGYVIWKQSKKVWPLWFLLGPYYLVLSVQTQRFDRWITLLTPVLSLMVGIFVVSVKNVFSLKVSKRFSKFLWGFLILALVWNLLLILNMDWQLAGDDTQQKMSDYIVENLSRDKLVLIAPGKDPLRNDLSKHKVMTVDLRCQDVDLSDTWKRIGGMYFVVDMTRIKMLERFANNKLYKKRLLCVKSILEHSKQIKLIENPYLNNWIYAPDRLVGGATLRYLHSPDIVLAQVNQSDESYELNYSLEELFKRSKNFEQKSDNGLESILGSQAILNGGIQPLPVGDYRLVVDYVSQIPINFDQPVMWIYLKANNSFKKLVNVSRKIMVSKAATGKPQQEVLDFSVTKEAVFVPIIVTTGNAQVEILKLTVKANPK